MLTHLTGTLELCDHQLVAFTAHITPNHDDHGCRIYRAHLPLFVDPNGTPLLVHRATLDVLPAHSTLRLDFDPDLPPATVPAPDPTP